MIVGIGMAGEGDGAAVLLHNALANPKAETGSLFSFGGEKGLKEARECLGRDACTAVGDGNDDTSGSGFCAGEAAAFDEDLGAEIDGAAGLRGLGSVGQ